MQRFSLVARLFRTAVHERARKLVHTGVRLGPAWNPFVHWGHVNLHHGAAYCGMGDQLAQELGALKGQTGVSMETAMECVSLGGLLGRVTPYERWRAPIDLKLRIAAIVSGPSILICLGPLLVVLVISLASMVNGILAGESGSLILAPLCGLLGLLVLIDLASLAVYISMLVVTRGLQEARPHWHWVAFGETVLGAMHGFFVALAVAMVVLVAIVLVVIACLFVIAALLGLLGMAAGSGN